MQITHLDEKPVPVKVQQICTIIVTESSYKATYFYRANRYQTYGSEFFRKHHIWHFAQKRVLCNFQDVLRGSTLFNVLYLRKNPPFLWLWGLKIKVTWRVQCTKHLLSLPINTPIFWLVYIGNFLKWAIFSVQKRYILAYSHWIFFQEIFIFISHICLQKPLG